MLDQSRSSELPDAPLNVSDQLSRADPTRQDEDRPKGPNESRAPGLPSFNRLPRSVIE